MYLVSDYFLGDGQPGFGANYQTAALSVMLPGRQGFGFYLHVPFLLHVEFPGLALLIAWHLLIKGRADLAAIIIASAAAILGIYYSRRPPAHRPVAPVLREMRRSLSGRDGD